MLPDIYQSNIRRLDGGYSDQDKQVDVCGAACASDRIQLPISDSPITSLVEFNHDWDEPIFTSLDSRDARAHIVPLIWTVWLSHNRLRHVYRFEQDKIYR